MSDDISTNADYDRLMGTLPAMLAMTINAAHYLVEKSNIRLDGYCTIGRGSFERFVKAARQLTDIRDSQQTFSEDGKILDDRIFVPIIGRPNIGQPVVNDHSDEAEIRADLVGRLYKERKLLDQILQQFRQLSALKDDAHAIRATDGGIFAYKVPLRLIENIRNYMDSPLLEAWHPGEFRSVEVAIALKEALGKATRTMESLFEGVMIPRLMPRAHEVFEFVDFVPETILVEVEGEVSIDDVIAEIEEMDVGESNLGVVEAKEPQTDLDTARATPATSQMEFNF